MTSQPSLQMFVTLLHSKRLYLWREVHHRQHRTNLSPHFEQILDSENWNMPGVPRLLQWPMWFVRSDFTGSLIVPASAGNMCISAPQMCCSVTNWLHVFYRTGRRQWSCLSLDQLYQWLVTSKYMYMIQIEHVHVYLTISEQTSFHSDTSHCVSRNVSRNVTQL